MGVRGQGQRLVRGPVAADAAYGVVGLGLDGAASPGQQVVRLSAGTCRSAKATAITSAALSVSFDGGKTWQAARITGASE